MLALLQEPLPLLCCKVHFRPIFKGGGGGGAGEGSKGEPAAPLCSRVYRRGEGEGKQGGESGERPQPGIPQKLMNRKLYDRAACLGRALSISW